MAAMDHENERAEWVEVGTYATGLEADMVKGALEELGIPVLVRSNAPGIFGFAYQGGVAGGVTLHVPSPELERALAFLDGHQVPPLSLVDDNTDDANNDGADTPLTP